MPKPMQSSGRPVTELLMSSSNVVFMVAKSTKDRQCVCVCVCENKFVCCVSSVIMGWMRVRGYHRTTDAFSLCWKDAASVPLIQAFIPGPPMHLEMSEPGHGGHGNDNDEESQ